LTLTFAADGFAPRILATFALGDIVAMLFHVTHNAILVNAPAKTAEQTVEGLVGSSFNFRHPFILLCMILYGIRFPVVRFRYSQKTDLAVAPRNPL
jgi:hypothetical protein